MPSVDSQERCAPSSTEPELPEDRVVAAMFVGFGVGWLKGSTSAWDRYEQELKRRAKKQGKRVERLCRLTRLGLQRKGGAIANAEFEFLVLLLCSPSFSQFTEPEQEGFRSRFNNLAPGQLVGLSIRDKGRLIQGLKDKGLLVCDFCAKLRGRGGDASYCRECIRGRKPYQREQYLARQRR
jgi:hypothetical protein